MTSADVVAALRLRYPAACVVTASEDTEWRMMEGNASILRRASVQYGDGGREVASSGSPRAESWEALLDRWQSAPPVFKHTAEIVPLPPGAFAAVDAFGSETWDVA